MSTVVSRTCTELHDADSGGGEARLLAEESKPLSEHRPTAAYVLLGDPGAGKTTEFKQERERLGDAALMISARDFIALDLDSHPDWRERVLFIDGLDEMRAGRSDSRVPLDEIRNRLDQLGQPGFRLSCREADWLGHSDRHSLKIVSPDSNITVLRLDPLSEPCAITLLESKHSVLDGREFMAEAHRLGLSGMLGNPLTLGLLADAVVEGGAWPETRSETFEVACRKMAAEANPEHLAGAGARPTSTVLDTAGYLCALQLLAGEAGYSLPTSAAVPSSVALAELGESPSGLSQDDLAHALATKLFAAIGEGTFAPVHRQIAEFLAGRYLARLIGDGLPARRVVALMVGKTDDRVVTSLRGLSAWLAAHSREARPILTDADPVGLSLYGDIGDLSTDEKEHLVESLSAFAAEGSLFDHQRRDGRSYGYRDDISWTFRSLATADMVPTMKELLYSAVDDTKNYQLIKLILGSLSQAPNPQSLIDLRPYLESILGSKTTLFRTRALHAYLHIVPSSDDRTRVLRLLLDNIQDGSISDPSDAVRGTLLRVLYPDEIKPSEVWRYSVDRNRDYPHSRFRMFWHQTLLDISSDQNIVELLDSLYADANNLIPALEQSDLASVPAMLLVRALEAVGDNHESTRLYGWLTTAAATRSQSPHVNEYLGRIRAWLESRPSVQQAVLLAALRQRGTEDSPYGVRYRYYAALYNSTLPPDFGLWCFNQAIRIADAEPAVSKALLFEAHESLDEPSTNSGLTLEMMRERTRSHPALAQHLDELCERRSANQPSIDSASIEDEFNRELENRLSQRDEERRKLREDWARQLRDQEAELRENRFSPQNLATLAEVSLGLVVGTDRHASPRDRISDFIGGDSRLVDAVMTALQGAVWRDDVPEVDQTISWSLESRHSWLAYPVLVGLRILDREDRYRLDDLPDTHKRKALAIHYCVPHGAGIPRFHDRWLRQNPEMVLDVLYRCAVADVRAGREVPSGLYELDAANGFDDQLHEVRLRLLEAFPTRSTGQQLSLLDRLLANALDSPNTKLLLDLARLKHAKRSIPVAQQVRWWATDALIVQGTRLRQLKSCLTTREGRVRHLAEFLKEVWDRYNKSSILSMIRDPSTLKDLIEMMGGWCTEPIFASGLVTLEMEISDMLVSLIRQLGSEAGDEAQRALAELVQDPDLEGWHEHLSRALEEQRVIHRDASYMHPTIEQVQETLRGGSPTNAGDLAALLVDRLDGIGQDLRGGSSDPWRPFWNEGRHRRPTEAKAEDSCRDALLDKLRTSLPDGVEAVREGSYAADARADIRVSSGGFNVPIEIKKDSHSDLWKAMRDQLMAQYTTDPAAEGHGIYLVLWFADKDKPVTRYPGSGRRPSTPEELREWLEADLGPEEARKISVVVLDVTKPGSNSARARRRSSPANRQRRALEQESAAASSGRSG